MVVYPTKRELMDAIVQVLSQNEVLSTSEINLRVSALLNLSEEQLTLESSTCSGTEYSYRMRWARTELKQKKIITNPKRGEWTLLKED